MIRTVSTAEQNKTKLFTTYLEPLEKEDKITYIFLEQGLL